MPFNYALHRKVPKNLQEEEAIFNQIPFQQRLQQDATGLAQTMVRHGLEKAEDAYDMRAGNVQYWDYVEKYHPKYRERVLQKAEELAKQLMHDFYAHPEKFPMPSKQQGGAGGAPPPFGAPPAMASFVLPNGRILVKAGEVYTVKLANEEIAFTADENEAIDVAMQKIAAREMSQDSGKVIEG